VVSDPSGAVVPGALVELRDNAKGTVHLARTDSDGAYRFFFLAPGKYTLKVYMRVFVSSVTKSAWCLGHQVHATSRWS
jgi:protocatechuate 3,4-dioxygenase beta subunit